jgi:PST family polysaccharide transporter
MVRKSLAVLGSLSAILGLILAFGAPIVVRVVFGEAFMPAVPILRVFGLLIPLQALCVVLSFQWMLPLGFDWEFNFVVFTSGIMSAAIGILLAPRMGALGMGIAVTIAQVYSLVAVHIILQRKGLSPFGRSILQTEGPIGGNLESGLPKPL